MVNDLKFQYAMSIILKHEGSYSNDKRDPAGPTKFGITQSDINQYWAALDLPKDVKNLMEDKAKEFYKHLYWNIYHYDEINSLIVATKIFDMAVNIGVVTAHILAQKSCNDLGYNLREDGLLNNKTFETINDICSNGHEKDLMKNICENQKNFYDILIGQHPNLKVFEKKWLERAAWGE